MTSPLAPPTRPFPASWAFVVQLRENTPLDPDRLTGRIEHIVSGEVGYFDSVTELLALIERALPHAAQQPTQSEQQR